MFEVHLRQHKPLKPGNKTQFSEKESFTGVMDTLLRHCFLLVYLINRVSFSIEPKAMIKNRPCPQLESTQGEEG
jgi:hypothetical protein